MKLQNELSNVETKFKENLPKIKEYAPRLKASKLKYQTQRKNYETRLAWDCMWAFIGTSTMCSWYDKYNCHDEHITTLAKRALTNLGVL